MDALQNSLSGARAFVHSCEDWCVESKSPRFSQDCRPTAQRASWVNAYAGLFYMMSTCPTNASSKLSRVTNVTVENRFLTCFFQQMLKAHLNSAVYVSIQTAGVYVYEPAASELIPEIAFCPQQLLLRRIASITVVLMGGGSHRSPRWHNRKKLSADCTDLLPPRQWGHS